MTAREATWGLVWAFANVNPPEPRAIVSHAFLADSSAPLCQPPVPGSPGPFVEATASHRCQRCLAAIVNVSLEIAAVRALRTWAWTVSALTTTTRGTAPTRAAAEAAGRAAIDAQFETVALSVADGPQAFFALRYARELRAEAKSRATPAAGASTAPIEYVYRSDVDWYPSGTPYHRTISARIVRTTARLVFVDRHSHSTEGGAVVVNAIALDRAALERGEAVRGWSKVAPSEAKIAEILAGYGLRTESSPAWATVLGVAFPCSADEARRAFRRAARAAHPDAGGTAESFRAVTEAHEQASRFFAARGAA